MQRTEISYYHTHINSHFLFSHHSNLSEFASLVYSTEQLIIEHQQHSVLFYEK